MAEAIPVSCSFDDVMAASGAVIRLRIAAIQGSAPREGGAWMIVSARGCYGTIGGGYLEFTALKAAQTLIAGQDAPGTIEMALGPETGQCCGGRITVTLDSLDSVTRAALHAEIAAERLHRPRVYLFGAGHVGRALTRILALLPVSVTVIDSRPGAISGLDSSITTAATPLPEQNIRDAAPGSAFVIATHDHGLDFLITAEALARPDAAYIGMIGSATKRARFIRYCRDKHPHLEMTRLICPIGMTHGNHDKRPAIIAVQAAAEIMAALSSEA